MPQQRHHQWHYREDGGLDDEYGDNCNNAWFTQLARQTQTNRHSDTNIHRLEPHRLVAASLTFFTLLYSELHQRIFQLEYLKQLVAFCKTKGVLSNLADSPLIFCEESSPIRIFCREILFNKLNPYLHPAELYSVFSPLLRCPRWWGCLAISTRTYLPLLPCDVWVRESRSDRRLKVGKCFSPFFRKCSIAVGQVFGPPVSKLSLSTKRQTSSPQMPGYSDNGVNLVIVFWRPLPPQTRKRYPS